MKEKPILFSTPMVQALLNTKPNTWPAEPVDPSKPYKWMTRRVVKPQPEDDGRSLIIEYGKPKRIWRGECMIWQEETLGKPRYKVGDILWVREAFQAWKRINIGDVEPPVYNGKDGFYTIGEFDYAYKADSDNPDERWRSSIFMPRAAARIFLEVKDVRIERLQRISYEDMNAEGFDLDDNEDFNMAEHYQIAGSPIEGGTPERFAFAAFWDRLNAKRGYSWERNPYVYVYGFMRVE